MINDLFQVHDFLHLQTEMRASLIEIDPILKLLIQLEMKINKYRKSALFEKCLLLIYYD